MSNRAHTSIGTVRQLEILVAVYEERSFTKAAARLFLAQPSVSMQLSKLADTVGLPLYYSHARQVFFTEAGEIMVKHARDILRDYQYLDLALSRLRGGESGRVSIGLVTTAKYFIPHLIGPFAESHPAIELSLKIGNRQEIIDRVDRDTDDFYVFSHPPRDQALELIPFLTNRLWPVAPDSHPLSVQSEVTLTDFMAEPFLSREVGSGTRYSIEAFLAERGFSLSPRMTIESNEAIRHAVLSRLGVSIVSEHTLNYGGEQGLSVLNVEGFPIESRWYLVRRLARPLSPAAAALAECLIQRQQNIGRIET